MFHFAVAGGEPRADFLWIIIERPVAAFVSDVAGLIHNVKAFGPSGVGVVGGVGHFVDAEGNGVFVALGEIVADGDALLDGLGLSVANVFLDVGLHLPLVGGMRFANVDGQKIGVVFVIVKEQLDVANLATEGRSSKTAEDEDERFAGGAFANVETIGAVERDEAGVGSVVSDFEVTAAHVGKGVADHVERVFGAASHFAEDDAGGDQEDAEADADPHEDFLLPRQMRLHASVSKMLKQCSAGD